MIIIPAIDLIDGKCVRLFKGDYNRQTNYSEDPASQAAKFADLGARRLHIVDLDAARNQGNNRAVIRRIRKSFPGVIECGGGIRSKEDIQEMLECGCDRLILGTVLAKQTRLCADWVKEFGPVFIGGIDALNGEVKISGWEEGSALKDTVLAKKAAEIGMISLIYTNIDKDGSLSGPDLERTNLMAKESGIPLILSGGIACDDDLRIAASQGHPLLKGAITGKAYYEGKLDLKKLLQEIPQTERMEW